MDVNQPFEFSVGLLNPKPAPKRLMSYLEGALALGPLAGRVMSSIESRFNPLGTCKRGDIVVFMCSGELTVGEVLSHCEIDAVPHSIVSIWELQRVDRCKGSAEFIIHDNPELIETDTIIDTVIASLGPGRVAKVLLPCHLR